MLPILSAMNAAQERERKRILGELAHARGVMPLLMKPRNGGRWTPEDRARIMRDMHALAGLSPYLVPLVMPGGFLLLPLLAWWLDRRRFARVEALASAGTQRQADGGDAPLRERDGSQEVEQPVRERGNKE